MEALNPAQYYSKSNLSHTYMANISAGEETCDVCRDMYLINMN